MTPEQTQQDNELIAVFDGWEIIPGNEDHKCFSCDDGKGPSMFCTCDQKKTRYRKESTTNDRPPYYNLRWEVLMPVVEKIESIQMEGHGYFGVHIHSNACTIQGTKFRSELRDEVYYFDIYSVTKLNATWHAVTQFIIWYNEQNKQP